MVNPGTDENHIRAMNATTKSAQSTNSLGNRLWYVGPPNLRVSQDASLLPRSTWSFPTFPILPFSFPYV
jgi:hypothetical protein